MADVGIKPAVSAPPAAAFLMFTLQRRERKEKDIVQNKRVNERRNELANLRIDSSQSSVIMLIESSVAVSSHSQPIGDFLSQE